MVHTHSYRGSGHMYGGVVPHDWNYYWLYLCLSFVCLLITAQLAKVKIGSFPVNPIYWHYWVVANAKIWPYRDKENPDKGYRAYIYVWGASVLFFIYSLFILVAIVF